MSKTAPVLLSLDTSSRSVGLALYDGAQVLFEAVWTSNDYHTVELAPAVADALQRTGLGVGSLAAISVALGPGSFTGLRVGLALAKGLALARRLPVVGIPTLDALAAAQPGQDIPLVAILRAGRGRLAAGWYQFHRNRWQSSNSPEVLTPEELGFRIHSPTRVCGELTAEERSQIHRLQPLARLASPANCLRRPGFLAELGWERWKAGKSDDPATLSPIYLHYPEGSALTKSPATAGGKESLPG